MSVVVQQKGNVVVDAFSGPGGLSLGFKRAGFSIALGLEKDSHAAETYRTNFPEADIIEGDVTNIDGKDVISSLDRKHPRRTGTVLVGGPPCQPFSRANRQNTGENHPSASAVDNFWRLLKEVEPDAFLFENVVAFERTGTLASLILAVRALGFLVATSKLDAQFFHVPQRRRRLFIGGVRNAKSFSLPEPQGPVGPLDQFLGNAERGPDVMAAISDLPRLPRGGGGMDKMEYPDLNGKDLCSYQKAAREGASKLVNHWSSTHTLEVRKTISYIRSGSSLTKVWGDLPLDIRKRYADYAAIQSNIYYRLRWKKVAPTIVHPRRAMLLHPRQNRILSVREAARLQSFPDSFKFCGMLDSQYQQVANAVPPLLAKALAETYISFLPSSH